MYILTLNDILQKHLDLLEVICFWTQKNNLENLASKTHLVRMLVHAAMLAVLGIPWASPRHGSLTPLRYLPDLLRVMIMVVSLWFHHSCGIVFCEFPRNTWIYHDVPNKDKDPFAYIQTILRSFVVMQQLGFKRLREYGFNNWDESPEEYTNLWLQIRPFKDIVWSLSSKPVVVSWSSSDVKCVWIPMMPWEILRVSDFKSPTTIFVWYPLWKTSSPTWTPPLDVYTGRCVFMQQKIKGHISSCHRWLVPSL